MRGQTGKRIGAAILSGAMLLNAASPVWADDEGPYTVPKIESIKSKSTDEYSEAQLNDSTIEYGELEFLVLNNNNTVISNKYTYQSLRDSFEEAEGTGAASSPTGGFADSDKSMDQALDGIKSQISKHKNEIKDLNNKLNAATDDATKLLISNNIGALQNTVDTLTVQKGYYESIQEVNSTMSDMMSSMANGSGMTADGLRDYYLQFSEVEFTLVRTAQSMYPTYYQLVYSLEQLNANLAVAETAYQGSLTQKELGMCTDNEVADALYNVTSIKNSISNLENQMASLKQELCKLVGKNFNEEISLGELPAVDYEYISAINLYEDIDLALKNNYTVRSKQNSIGNHGPGSSYESRRSDTYALDAEREAVRSEVNKAYLDIQTKKNELDTAKEKLAATERQMAQAEQQYSLGLISKMEYEQKKVGYVTDETAVKTAESQLLDAVNAYRWSVQGL